MKTRPEPLTFWEALIVGLLLICAATYTVRDELARYGIYPVEHADQD